MRPGSSLQRRLGLGLTAGVLLLWLVATAVSGYVVRDELDEAFDRALQETAQRLLPLAIRSSEDPAPPPAQRLDEAGRSYDTFLTYILRDGSGRLLLHSHDADPRVFPANPSHGFHDAADYRIYVARTADGAFIIEVAEPVGHRREAAMEATLALLAPLPFLVPLSLLGVWWFSRSSLRSVRALRAQIEARGAGDLTPTQIEGLPAEIAPGVDAVNRLMERLRRTVEAERSFAANSAHELRTPIAGALAQTQRLIAEAPTADVRDRATQIEGALRHLARLSAKLLELARSEVAAALHQSPQDLLPALALIVDEVRRSADSDIRFSCDEGTMLPGAMDMDAFAIVMRNLIENALKHGDPAAPVSVFIDDESAVHVVNAGAVVAPDLLARLKRPFERAGSAAPGVGLGLAIAEAVAAGAGARIDLHSPAQGRVDGFEAIVTLPAGAPNEPMAK